MNRGHWNQGKFRPYFSLIYQTLNGWNHTVRKCTHLNTLTNSWKKEKQINTLLTMYAFILRFNLLVYACLCMCTCVNLYVNACKKIQTKITQMQIAASPLARGHKATWLDCISKLTLYNFSSDIGKFYSLFISTTSRVHREFSQKVKSLVDEVRGHTWVTGRRQ